MHNSFAILRRKSRKHQCKEAEQCNGGVANEDETSFSHTRKGRICKPKHSSGRQSCDVFDQGDTAQRVNAIAIRQHLQDRAFGRCTSAGGKWQDECYDIDLPPARNKDSRASENCVEQDAEACIEKIESECFLLVLCL